MQLKYTAIVLALATSISAQGYSVMSCNTNVIPCQAAGVACHNENTPWACPVSNNMVEAFSIACRNANGYPENRKSDVTLEVALQDAGCKV